MTTRKSRKIVIQITVILMFLFGVITAYIAYKTGSLLMGIIFLNAIVVITLLAILFMLETITEILETR